MEAVTAAQGVGQLASLVIGLVKTWVSEAEKEKSDAKALKKGLADIAEKVEELRLASVRLVNENSELVEAMKFKGRLVFSGNAFWLQDEDGKPTGSAVCPNCWQRDGKPNFMMHSNNRRDRYQCPVCGLVVLANPGPDYVSL